MLYIVAFGEQQQQAVAHHIVVGTPGLKRGILGRIHEFEIAGQARLVQALDVARGGEAVIQHLVERQRMAAAVEVAVGGTGLPQCFPACAVGIVELGQEAGPRDIDVPCGGLEAMPFRKHLRIAEDDLLHDFLQRQMGGRKRVSGLHGKHERNEPSHSLNACHR